MLAHALVLKVMSRVDAYLVGDRRSAARLRCSVGRSSDRFGLSRNALRCTPRLRAFAGDSSGYRFIALYKPAAPRRTRDRRFPWAEPWQLNACAKWAREHRVHKATARAISLRMTELVLAVHVVCTRFSQIAQ